MITTIIFDLAEVLLKGTKGIGYLLGPMLNLPPEQVFPLLKGPELESLFHGQLSEEEYWQKILHKNQWKLSIEQLKEVVRKNFQEINGTRAILEKLKQKLFKELKKGMKNSNKKAINSASSPFMPKNGSITATTNMITTNSFIAYAIVSKSASPNLIKNPTFTSYNDFRQPLLSAYS